MKPVNVAIVGGESLAGRELREVLSESKLKASLKLIGVDEDTSTLTEQGGEPLVITPLDEENLRGADFVLLAGSLNSSRKARGYTHGAGTGAVLIDLTHALEDEPSARLRAPIVEAPGLDIPPESIQVIAHPAAIALTLFLTRLRACGPIQRSTIHVFEPASERGRKGLDELQNQTVGLLSLRTMAKDVFDAQLSFNMLASYGSEAPESLAAIELRIERHLATLLAARGNIPLPSLRAVQAPVFHGYSFSAHVEFETKPSLDEIAKALPSGLVDVRGGDLEPPSNVGTTGQSGIAVGSIAADRNNPMACWFWIAADNLRLRAENAVALVRSLMPGNAA